MAEQTRAEKEMSITMVSLALWGAIVLFLVVAGLFLFEIIPSGNGTLIAIILCVTAFLNWVLIKVVVGKMQAGLGE